MRHCGVLFSNMKILRVLDKYQIQNDAKVAKLARQTIREIISDQNCPKSRQRGRSSSQSACQCGHCAYLALNKSHPDEYTYMSVHARPDLDQRKAIQHCSEDTLDDPKIWDTDQKRYSDWVCRLCATTIGHQSCQDSVLQSCHELAGFKPEFAQLLLPYAMFAVRDHQHDVLSPNIQSTLNALEVAKSPKRRCIQVLLRSLDYLRQKRISIADYDIKSHQKVYYLDVDYLIVAKAALKCDAYFTALFYVEQKIYEDRDRSGSSSAAAAPAIMLRPHSHSLGESPQHESVHAVEQALQMKIYSSINEPDGIYGVNNSLDTSYRLLSFEHERAWDKSLGLYDTLLQPTYSSSSISRAPAPQDAVDCRKGVLSSLARLGFTHVLETYCRGASAHPGTTPAESVPLQEYQYEAAWRACRWDEQLGSQLLERGMPLGFNAALFKCIQALRVADADTFKTTLAAGRLSLIHDVSATSLESTKRVYSTLSKMQMLGILEEAWNVDLNDPSQRSSWNQRIDGIRDKFEFVEPVLSLQVAVLNACKLGQAPEVAKNLVTLASCGRKARQFQIASAAFDQLFRVSWDNRELQMAGMLEEARSLKAQGDDDKAVLLAKHIKIQFETAGGVTPATVSDACRLAGKWAASARSESSEDIIHLFMNPAIEKAQSDVKRQLKGRLVLASFCDVTMPSNICIT